MNIDLSQFVGVFFEETAEHLAEMEHLLLALDHQAADVDQWNTIFRAAHSIKGSAGVFGFQALTSVTHVLENLLDKLRNQTMVLQPGMVDTFLSAVDTLKAIADAYRAGSEPDMVAANRMCERLEQFTRASNTSSEPAYGLFVEPAAAEESYGFFEPAADSAAAGTETAYGLFDDSAATPAGNTDETAYGLFDSPGTGTTPVANYVEQVLNGSQQPSTGMSAGPARRDDAAPTADKQPTPPPIPAPLPARLPTQGAAPAVLPDAAAASADAVARNASRAPVAGTPAAKASAGTGKKPDTSLPESTSIRVNTEKIDQIINLVGELVITQSMLAQTAAEYETANSERLQDRLKTLERNTRDLQDAVMSIRMMPVSFIFNRFPRVVRDLAQKLGKKVDLVIEGETTELDKGLIEKLADPLTHLVRNSIDHGIEMPEQRLALGKPETGVIRLSAFQRSGSIVIEVEDDGGGLRRQKILAKARANGLPVADEMTDAEVWQLIFAPGFSTAEQVTDVSGRGVGMDVVKRNIQEIGGRIDIQSSEGSGSRMSIRLPLTLAILDGMVVAVGSERYVIPLVFISESLQPKPEEIRTITGAEQVVMVRDEYIPLSALHEHMGVTPKVTDPTKGLLVILENEGSKIALLVDELLGQQQVVIKSLEENYRRIDGVAGATIMGDGRVALILHIEQLVQRYARPALLRPAPSPSHRGAA